MENLDDINGIISSLSDEDINRLKSLADDILGSGSGSSKSALPSVPPAQNNALMNISTDDIQMIAKAKKLFDSIGNTPSKNADLIAALKPHLSVKSSQKADQAIKILRLLEILPHIKDLM